VRGRGAAAQVIVSASSPIEPLDAACIRSTLPAGVRLGGLSVHGAIDSTNSWLQERSLALTAPYACLCEHQLAGRGRRGRVWEDGTGRDLCLSLLWRFGVRKAHVRAQGLSLGVGVAVARALGSTGARGIGLKWPNDVVWQDRKVGGILIERSTSGRSWVVVIGVGINVHPAAGVDSQASRMHLASIPGAQVSRNRLATSLIAEISAECARYETWGAGPAIREWMRLDALRGRAVRVHRSDGEVAGIARGVDETGELLVEVDGGIERFVSGEISLRPEPCERAEDSA